MNRGLTVFLGGVLTFASAWLGLVLLPYAQLNDQSAFASPSGDYPRPLSERAEAGRKVYRANGCIYCHSQQVRSQHFGNGADLARGWGQRRTVSRDYIYDRPVLLGTMRTGPDLAAIGERNPSPSWHHEHLLNPRSKNEWSIMPAFPFLYKREKVENGRRSPQALDLGREWTVRPGRRYRPTDAEWSAASTGKGVSLDFWLGTPEEEYQVVPTEEADNLVAYLVELRKTAVPLPEANEP